MRVTFGQALKSQFSEDILTIGVFAREGSAPVGQEEPELKELRPIQDSEIDSYLNKLSGKSFLADLVGTDAKTLELLNRPATIRIKGIGRTFDNSLDEEQSQAEEQDGESSTSKVEAAKRKRKSLAQLLARVFQIDVRHCMACGGEMKILAAILETAAIGKILIHLRIPHKPPGIATSRLHTQMSFD